MEGWTLRTVVQAVKFTEQSLYHGSHSPWYEKSYFLTSHSLQLLHPSLYGTGCWSETILRHNTRPV